MVDRAGFATLRRRPALLVYENAIRGIPRAKLGFKSRQFRLKNKKLILSNEFMIFHGGPGGIWTRDQKIKSLLLYQLSYRSRYGAWNIANYLQKANFFVEIWKMLYTSRYRRNI